MAVNSSPSSLLSVDDYILDGFKKSGMLPIDADIGFDSRWNGMAAYGRRVLNRLVEGLANEGFLPHFTTFELLTLVAGTPTYSLDSDILNVVDYGSYIPVSNGSETVETNGETPVKPFSRHAWNQLAAKDSTGTPTNFYLERNGSTLTLYVWPVPDEAGKIRLQVHRIPGSNSTGSDNVDLKRHWGSWIVHALAYEFMTDAKLPIEERALMGRDRDAILAKIKTYETNNEPPDLVFCHSTPWSSW